MGYKQTTMKRPPLNTKEFGFGSVGFARAQQKPNGSIEPQRMEPLEPTDCGSAGGVLKKKKKEKSRKKTKLKRLKKERLKDAAAVDVDEDDDDVATKLKPYPKSESEQHKATERGAGTKPNRSLRQLRFLFGHTF